MPIQIQKGPIHLKENGEWIPMPSVFPEKGIDYWTDEDKQEIISYVTDFIVTVATDGVTFTSDKTFSETMAAHNAGRRVVFSVPGFGFYGEAVIFTINGIIAFMSGMQSPSDAMIGSLVMMPNDITTLFLANNVINDPHPYALDGANLKTVFGTAAALYAALAQEDYSKIRNLDYWPITFNGTYRDYGEWVALTGTDYYSDTACKDLVGQVENDTVVSYEDASPAYYSATIGGTKRYIKMQDCQRWREKTINMTAKMEANINAYWGYGDSGNISGKVPHIMWLARDGIAWLKFRSTNQQWADAVEQIETGDGSTTEYTPNDATLKCVRYCTVDGVLKAYNTDYTVDTGTGKLTFKAGKVPTSGQEIIISRTTHDYPWKGSALYQTFNDPDHGLLRLIDDTEFASHIYGGAGGLGMRYAGETRPVSNSTSVSWTDRGKMFLPTESEVWGLGIYGQKGTYYHLPQLAVFANGGRRRSSKSSSDGGWRNDWWLASSTTATTVATVNNYGIVVNGTARNANAAVPGFIGT